MDYASTPDEPYDRRQLQSALSVAAQLELDVEQLRALCLPIIGSFFDGELPLRSQELPEPD